MSSLKQIVANRRNALKSTGPTTPEGKQHARCNAVRHGLTAETVIGVLEDANDYAAFEAAVTADYDAESAVERELVLRLASVLWRLRRATGIETALFDSVTSHKFSLRAHGSYRDVLESERETPSGDDQRCSQKDIAESFLRLAETSMHFGGRRVRSSLHCGHLGEIEGRCVAESSPRHHIRFTPEGGHSSHKGSAKGH
jgi:hypothetical protein